MKKWEKYIEDNMRYVQYLIDQVRRETENEDVSAFVGISDAEFLQYFNDAQHRLQSLITAKHSRVFTTEATIDIVSGQESYDLPSDIFLDNKIHSAEYSSTGDTDDYYILDEGEYRDRAPGSSGSPSKYIRLSGKIILAPAPTSGKIRLNYVKRVRELDLRRAKLGVSSTGTVLTLENNTLLTDAVDLNNHSYICIVDDEGVSKNKNLKISSVTETQINITSSVSVSANDFIVGGKDTTTHSDLPRNVERYLISYCAWKILKRDSSVDSREATGELQEMERDIIESYAMISDDVQFIPEINTWDDWGI
ncbi:MAG: hypothetical protein CMG00_06120 [Candidatus Marinimicrobia bacterium]|nr:hypothetical protein [Candidatus Neomarinimicrobiota bacterium]